MRETAGLSLMGAGVRTSSVGAEEGERREGVASWASIVAAPAAEAPVGLSVPGAGVESTSAGQAAEGGLAAEGARGREGSSTSTWGGGGAVGEPAASSGADGGPHSLGLWAPHPGWLWVCALRLRRVRSLCDIQHSAA
jgi:hypothetical protein